MNEEREMILKMLKDGKISVNEAQALLDVLEEETEDAGFSAQPSTTPAAATSNAGHDTGEGHASHGHASHGTDEHTGRAGAFNFKIDLDGISDSVRETMRGVSDALKGAFDGLADLDIGAEIHRAMGRSRSETERELACPAGDAAAFVVRNNWGDIRVTGADQDQVTVTARIAAWGSTTQEAAQTLEAVLLTLEPNGEGAIVLDATVEQDMRSKVRIEYDVRLPASLDVRAHTASGDLWIEGVAGRHEVSTASGDINIADARDALTLSSKSGDVVLGATEGSITVSTLSGDIAVTGFSGELQATTKSGDIHAADASGQFTLKTLSGDVDLDVRELSGPVVVSAVSGDVSVRLPSDVGISLRAKSVTGDVACRLPLEHIAKKTEHAVSGTVGAGGVEVEITAVSGDIALS